MGEIKWNVNVVEVVKSKEMEKVQGNNVINAKNVEKRFLTQNLNSAKNLNNVGVRKTAMFIGLGCSRTAVTNWAKKSKEKLDKELKKFEPNYSKKTDIIELDEIYTYVKKGIAKKDRYFLRQRRRK